MTDGHLDRNLLSLLMCVFHLPGPCIQHQLALYYPVGLMSSSPHDEAVTPPGAQTGDRARLLRRRSGRRHSDVILSFLTALCLCLVLRLCWLNVPWEGVKISVQISFSTRGSPAVQLFTEMSSLHCQERPHLQEFPSGPRSVLCIDLSVFPPVPRCLDYCSFRGSPEVCWHLSSNFLFVLLSWVGYLASFVSLWKQVINIPRTACWEGQLICDRDTQITQGKNENKLVPQQLDINKPKKKEKELELNTIHNSIYKINPDWIRDLSGKCELVKHFRRYRKKTS